MDATRSRWVAVTIGPIWMVGSSGYATGIEATRVVNRSMKSSWRTSGDQQSGLQAADLAAVAQRAEAEGLDGELEVGVVEDDGGRLAAQLQSRPGEVAPAQLRDASACGRRPGEG